MYHPNNLGLQPYPHWRLKILAFVGWALGIQFKVAGIPFGGSYEPKMWDAFWSSLTHHPSAIGTMAGNRINKE